MQETTAGKVASEVLEVLSAKFGTTAEHLWGVMVTQQRVYAWVALAAAVIIPCVLAFVSVLTWKHTGTRIASPEFGSYAKQDSTVLRWAVVVVSSLVSALFVFGWGYDALTGFMNPEYAALREVIRLIK